MNRFLRLSVLLLLCLRPAWSAELQADASTVLITGSNRGIGFEFVKQYAERGWNVIATCRDPDDATALQQYAREHSNVFVETLDLLDHAGIDALADKYQSQPIDILLNNAGLMRGPDLGQMVGSIDYDEFDRFYRTNAAGPLKVTEAFYPNIKMSDTKIIAALTTGKDEKGIPVPGFSLYKTSKAALDAIQKEIAIRWRRQGVKAITLLPGRVLTTEGATAADAVPIEQSIAGMIAVLERVDMQDSGRTIQWDGEVIE